jgi:hypothetical protein
MQIYYKKLSDKQTENLTRSEIKELQSKIGREIINYVMLNVYKISMPEIVIENSKPKFLNSNIHFSITHSNKIIAVGFDNFPLGLDIEYMKERDFKALSKHYDIKTSDKIEFYKKWTQIEAEIKIQSEIKQMVTEEFENDYMMSLASSNTEKLNITKILIK